VRSLHVVFCRESSSAALVNETSVDLPESILEEAIAFLVMLALQEMHDQNSRAPVSLITVERPRVIPFAPTFSHAAGVLSVVISLELMDMLAGHTRASFGFSRS